MSQININRANYNCLYQLDKPLTGCQLGSLGPLTQNTENKSWMFRRSFIPITSINQVLSGPGEYNCVDHVVARSQHGLCICLPGRGSVSNWSQCRDYLSRWPVARYTRGPGAMMVWPQAMVTSAPGPDLAWVGPRWYLSCYLSGQWQQGDGWCAVERLRVWSGDDYYSAYCISAAAAADTVNVCVEWSAEWRFGLLSILIVWRGINDGAVDNL